MTIEFGRRLSSLDLFLSSLEIITEFGKFFTEFGKLLPSLGNSYRVWENLTEFGHYRVRVLPSLVITEFGYYRVRVDFCATVSCFAYASYVCRVRLVQPYRLSSKDFFWTNLNETLPKFL